ncbi:MAG: DUF1565 domain-containing protein, partial [Planctomycetota bacterium]
MRLAQLLLIFLSAAAQASATQLFVDPVNGDDASSGSSPDEAVRTITRALRLAGTDETSIYLAPGTYDAASGEAFPLEMWGGQDLLATPSAPGARPVIDFAGRGVGLIIHDVFASQNRTLLAGLDLRGGRIGIRTEEDWFRIENCTISDCDVGLDMEGRFWPASAPVITRSSISHCGTGIRYQGESGLTTDLSVTIEDCDTGLDLRLPGADFFGWFFTLRGVARRCGTGLRIRSNSAFFERVFVEMEITKCDLGVDLESAGPEPLVLKVFRSTVADCAEGLLIRTPLSPFSEIHSSILADNGSDAPLGLQNAAIRFSTVTSGSLAGSGVV